MWMERWQERNSWVVKGMDSYTVFSSAANRANCVEEHAAPGTDGLERIISWVKYWNISILFLNFSIC